MDEAGTLAKRMVVSTVMANLGFKLAMQTAGIHVIETTVGDRPAIVPAIHGSAWITGITQVIVDPTDPFPEGYLLSDTWPGPDSQQ